MAAVAFNLDALESFSLEARPGHRLDAGCRGTAGNDLPVSRDDVEAPTAVLQP
jgi:hypothetical protein